MRIPRLTWLLFMLVAAVALLIGTGCGRSDVLSDDFGSPDGSAGYAGSGGAAGSGGSDGDAGDASADADAGADADAAKDGSDASATVVSVAVTPPVASVASGTKVVLHAVATYSDGTTADVTGAALWTSSDGAIATVASGVVSAVAPGQVSVTALIGGVSGSATITVPTATLVSIAITPADATVGVQGAVQYTATATLSDATTQDVTASATWAATPAGVASISAGGLATGLAAGQTTITAQVGAVSGKASLVVTPATIVSIAVTPTDPVIAVGVTLPFTAIATFSDSSIADVTATATWDSSDPTTLSLAASVGTSLAAGTSIVSATVGGVVGSTTVTVSKATLTSIAVTPPSTTLAPNGAAKLTATGSYSDGTTQDLTQSVVWSSSDAAVAAVSNASGSQGLVTGLAPGGAVVSATFGGVTGSAKVTVTAATLVSIAVTPANPSAPKSTTVGFTAKGTYSDSSVVDLTTSVAWSTDDAAIASISNAAGSNGVAKALAVGSTGVHATLGGVTGSAKLTVTAATLVSITVTPAGSSLAVGTKQLMKATGDYSDGSTVDLTAAAVWSTGDAAIATVSNASGAQGLLTAVGPGTTSVTATAAGVSGSTSLTVTSPTLAQIVVSPTDPTRAAGENQQFTAMAIFSNNTSQNVTNQASWSSSDASVASITNGPGPKGRATALSAGKTTITASYQGLSGSTTFVVSAATLVSIQVVPIDPTMPAGQIQQFQATAIFSDNTSQNVTGQATWTSTVQAVATVTTGPGPNRGRVTAVAAGTAQIQATFQGITGSSKVTVSAATLVSISVFPATGTAVVGTTTQLSAQAIYSDNTSQTITNQATWLSSDTNVIGVSDANPTKGLAKATGPGTATLSASYQGLTGKATFTISAATVVSIQVTPPQPTVATGTPVKFSATAIMSDNTSQNVTGQATWTSSDTAIAAVSDAQGSKGLTQTLAAGTATITATWNGVSGSTTLTVSPVTLKEIQITPFAPTIPVGFATQLSATAIYSDNTTADLTDLVTWISSAPAVAAVSDQLATKGRLSPLAAGTATVSASYQGVTGTDVVTVSSATLTGIVVTPATVSIALKATQQFTAMGSFSDGSSLDVTAYVTWLSDVSAVVSVSNAAGTHGLATALSSGKATLTAVRGSVSGTAQATVP